MLDISTIELKFCILRTSENAQEINSFFNKHNDSLDRYAATSGWIYGGHVSKGYCRHTSEQDDNGVLPEFGGYKIIDVQYLRGLKALFRL